jgi:hypothetical protein
MTHDRLEDDNSKRNGQVKSNLKHGKVAGTTICCAWPHQFVVDGRCTVQRDVCSSDGDLNEWGKFICSRVVVIKLVP